MDTWKCSQMKACVPSTKQHQRQYNSYIEKWKNGEVTGTRGHTGTSHHIMRYIWIKYEGKCARCGWDKVNPFTDKTPLEVDHVDGSWDNNSEENLILLCPNCHSLTNTY